MYALSRAGTEKAKVFLAQGMETKRQMMLAHARLDDAMERLRLLTAAGDDTEEKKRLAGMMQEEEEAFLRHLCSLLDKEKEIQMAIAMNENEKSDRPKPQQIIEKMAAGKMGKYFKENCLIEQAFVKDDSMTVGQYVEKAAKEMGKTVKVVGYVRFEKGEGLAKREDDFAAEVAGMVK